MNETSFELILHAGSSKSNTMEAIEHARQGDFRGSDIKITQAQFELVEAHEIQTKLLNKQSKGAKENPDMLLVHAQDHLTAAQTQLEMAKEIINLYDQIDEIRAYLGIENFSKQCDIKILLVCGQGMSTSLLVQNMYLHANEGDYIESISFEELSGVIGEYDVIMLSPQIRYRLRIVNRMINPRTQAIGFIDMEAYGKMNGEGVYQQARELFTKINH